MEKRELDSMSKLRGLFFSLGLVAMSVLMAGEARAESLILSVFAGTDTTVAPIFTTTGGANSVTANVGVLNSDLAAAGFGAYSFTNLGGSSNNPGSTALGPLGGAYILNSGNLVVTHGGSGEGTPITVVLTEGGFTLPANGPTLVDTATANIAGATGSQGSEGVFRGATGAPTTTAIPGLTSSGIQTSSTPLGTYVTPFSLESQTILSLTATNSTLPGSNGFSQKVQVLAASTVPEPASIVMMLTGMPLPLVLVGLLRRRQAA
jgi:hypothetical protein